MITCEELKEKIATSLSPPGYLSFDEELHLKAYETQYPFCDIFNRILLCCELKGEYAIRINLAEYALEGKSKTALTNLSIAAEAGYCSYCWRIRQYFARLGYGVVLGINGLEIPWELRISWE